MVGVDINVCPFQIWPFKCPFQFSLLFLPGILAAVGDIYGLREVVPSDDVSNPYLM